MNKLIRFGFASYESLVQKLGSADSPSTILQLFNQNRETFKHEHVVLSLRMLGRFSRQIQNDQDFGELTGRLNDIVDQLTEYDIVDVLFWYRKFRTNRLSTNVSNQTQALLLQKIQQLSENQMFSFRNMCNIYYDLAILQQNNDYLAKIIGEQILVTKQLSPFILNQLLQAQVQKIQACNVNKNDALIFNNSLKALETSLEDYDVEQKSFLFKTLANIQFQNLTPKFRLPQLIKVIKDQLLEKVELLQEESVLNIFSAYQDLPKNFENNLLKDLKDMLVSTIDHNPANLSTKFLIQLTDRIQKLQFKLPYELSKKVIGELVKRINNDDFDTYQIQGLCQALQNRRFDELVEALQKKNLKNLKVQDYLFSCGVNLSQYLNDLPSSDDKISLQATFRYAIYAARDNQEKAQKYLQLAKDSIQINPLHSLRLLNDINLNHQVKYKLIEEAYQLVVEQIQSGKYEFKKISRDLFNFACSFKCRTAFLQLYDQYNQANQPVQERGLYKTIAYKLLQEIKEYDQDKVQLIFQLLQKDPKSIPLQKLVDFLTMDQTKFQNLLKNDQLQWLTHVLISGYLAQPSNRLFFASSLIHRYENTGNQSKHIYFFVKRISEEFRRINPTSPYPDQSIVQSLINYGLLTPADAIIELQKEKAYGNRLLKVQLMSIASQGENVPENIKELIEKTKSEAHSQFFEQQEYFGLLELVTLGGLSQQEIQEVKTKMKTVVNALTPGQYFDLVINAKDQYLVRELMNLFQTFGAKLGLVRMIRIIQKFQHFSFGTQMVYNILLEQLGQSFNTMNNEQRVQSLTLFAEGKLKQVDFFEKNLQKISKNVQNYKYYFGEIIDSVTELGFVEPQIVELVSSLFDKQNINDLVAQKLVVYYVLAGKPIEEIEQVGELIDSIRSRDMKTLTLVYEILRREYPQSKTFQVLETFFKTEKPGKFKEQFSTPSTKHSYPIEYLHQYLQLLNLKIESNFTLDNFNVELYLPECETIVFPLHGQYLNFDKISLSGQALLTKRLLSNLAKNVVVVNFREFNEITNHDDKVKYLINQGIPITIDVSTIDFSQLKIQDRKEKKNVVRNYQEQNDKSHSSAE